ncbi:MAG: sensor histidine kinase [Oscillatoriales cyanobacterium C42_A2020_001]|nr:sensor histidine kinase [Leptolyngbyaceae cyanobacterium C42_A2020_001]
MGKSGSSSFRRILLSRILLLSIPILLVGEYVVYRKARSGVIATARQNLMESAIRKAEDIQTVTGMLQANLLASSKLFVEAMPSPSPQTFVEQVQQWLPKPVHCVQLVKPQTGAVVGSTCGSSAIARFSQQQWAPRRNEQDVKPSDVLVSQGNSTAIPAPSSLEQTRLNLVLTAPIYQANGELNYLLSTQVTLQRREFGQQASLQGYTVVINQDGVILAHPAQDRIGQTVAQQPNAQILQSLVSSAIAGKQDTLQLFREKEAEWLAGYTAVPIPAVHGKNQTWVILAIAPIGNALHNLQGIQQVLLLLTLGLIGASTLATLFVTKDLAAPLEKLGNYALQICDRLPSASAPKNFKIRELNQLSEALDIMVKQLDERADELEIAWQEAQAANQIQSEFLATTSHELRTPLNAIIGSVRLVKDGCCDSWEETLEFLQQADDAAIHLLKIINDLLDISRIEAGKVELNLQLVAIPELCQQCLRMMQFSAEKKRIALSVDIAPKLQKVPLDERRVRQMVINLLSNAVKFTPEGGQVELRAWQGFGSQLEQENRPDRSPINATTPYLCLEVVDSGIGIPPERWHLLFRPFKQIDASSTRNYEGTGLGLALTKRLAELHGGTLSFDSVPEKGSVFRIWLPAPDAES